MTSADERVIDMLMRLEAEARCKYMFETDPEKIPRRKAILKDAQNRLHRWQMRQGHSGEVSCLVPACHSAGVVWWLFEQRVGGQEQHS